MALFAIAFHSDATRNIIRRASNICRRYATLRGTDLLDVDYRTKKFSCSRCGSEAWMCVIEPVKDMGMHDYRPDEIEDPQRHPAAVDRLTGKRPSRKVGR